VRSIAESCRRVLAERTVVLGLLVGLLALGGLWAGPTAASAASPGGGPARAVHVERCAGAPDRSASPSKGSAEPDARGELVEMPMSITLASSTNATDVGLAVPLQMTITGGRAPYRVDWQTLPGGPDENVSVADGNVSAVIVGHEAGRLWVRVTATDANWMTDTVVAVVADIHPAPTLLVEPVSRAIDAGAMAEVTGLVSGGTPPFAWTAAASLPAVNVSGAAGVADPSEPALWSGRFVDPGNATIAMTIVDAAGVPVSANATIEVHAAFADALAVETVEPEATVALNLSAYASGGLAPYAFALTLSDGESDSGVLASAGAVDWVAHPQVPGYLLVSLSVTDALQQHDRQSATVLVGPAPPASASPPSSPVPSNSATAGAGDDGAGSASSWAGAGAGIALLAGLAGFALWRRRRPAPSKAVDPGARDVEIVRKIVEECDGSPRPTLRLLAEEEGVGAAAFDQALARLEAEGRVRSETGADGAQRVHWVAPASVASGDDEKRGSA
jgi:hypothetical protein